LALQDKGDVPKLADTTEAEKRLKAKILQQKKALDQSPAVANTELPREESPASGAVTQLPSTPAEVRKPFNPIYNFRSSLPTE